jgi:hypothetical protein
MEKRYYLGRAWALLTNKQGSVITEGQLKNDELLYEKLPPGKPTAERTYWTILNWTIWYCKSFFEKFDRWKKEFTSIKSKYLDKDYMPRKMRYTYTRLMEFST